MNGALASVCRSLGFSLHHLDRDFCVRVSRWPEVTAAISQRIMQRAHWMAFQLAVCNLRRVDDRLLLVLWHFAAGGAR